MNVKNFKSCAFFALSLACCLPVTRIVNAQSVSAYQLWEMPSFFRGFNYSYDSPASQQDLINLKSSGATIVYLSTEGFLDMAAPYNTLNGNISDLDTRIGFCDAAGVRYAIAVRRGPGRGDVYLQSVNADPPSTVWKNNEEQQLYGSMLRQIAARYASDTLFVGITPTVEPNPGSDSLCCIDTTLMLQYFASDGIDFTAITQLWVDSIRAASKTVPVLIQGPGYTNPDLFSLVPIVNDPYVVYEFHSYRPQPYAEATASNTETYPGQYFSYQTFTLATFNKSYIDDSLYDYIKQIHRETGAPIFMGEFGLELPQTGGPQFLSDISGIAIENGWAFAYWDWHTKTDSNWNYNKWGGGYWPAVIASLNQGTSGVAENIPNSSVKIISQFSTPRELFIEWPEMEQSGLPIEINIFDILGRDMRTLKENSSRFPIDISELADGIYMLTFCCGQSTAQMLFAGGR